MNKASEFISKSFLKIRNLQYAKQCRSYLKVKTSLIQNNDLNLLKSVLSYPLLIPDQYRYLLTLKFWYLWRIMQDWGTYQLQALHLFQMCKFTHGPMFQTAPSNDPYAYEKVKTQTHFSKFLQFKNRQPLCLFQG